MATLEVWNCRTHDPSYFPAHIQVLSRDDSERRPEWQGLSGQLRTHVDSLRADLGSTTDAVRDSLETDIRVLADSIMSGKENSSAVAEASRRLGLQLMATDSRVAQLAAEVAGQKAQIEIIHDNILRLLQQK